MKNLQLWIKEFFDRIISAVLIIVVLPLYFLISILIKAGSKGPVLFIQERIGRMGKPFLVCKFRTMAKDAMRLGGYETGESDPRITQIGKFLRRWSLDELPQLLNIIKGEMSFVGPRPTLAYQVERYSAREKRRLLMKPGITGLAQVNGRNLLSWPERIEYDLQYIDHFSLFLDFKILLKTIFVLIKKEGIYRG